MMLPHTTNDCRLRLKNLRVEIRRLEGTNAKWNSKVEQSKMNGDEKETWYERAGNDIKAFMDQLEVWWEILGEQEGWLQQAYYR